MIHNPWSLSLQSFKRVILSSFTVSDSTKTLYTADTDKTIENIINNSSKILGSMRLIFIGQIVFINSIKMLFASIFDESLVDHTRWIGYQKKNRVDIRTVADQIYTTTKKVADVRKAENLNL